MPLKDQNRIAPELRAAYGLLNSLDREGRGSDSLFSGRNHTAADISDAAGSQLRNKAGGRKSGHIRLANNISRLFNFVGGTVLGAAVIVLTTVSLVASLPISAPAIPWAIAVYGIYYGVGVGALSYGVSQNNLYRRENGLLKAEAQPRAGSSFVARKEGEGVQQEAGHDFAPSGLSNGPEQIRARFGELLDVTESPTANAAMGPHRDALGRVPDSSLEKVALAMVEADRDGRYEVDPSLLEHTASKEVDLALP